MTLTNSARARMALMTDGRLLGDGPGWLERTAAVAATAAILFAAYASGLLAWPRIQWLLPTAAITSAVLVWFPDFVAGLASAASIDHLEVPTAAVRVVGWGVLVSIATITVALWVSLR